MKYNYVVFGSNDPYYLLGYDELNNHSDSIYFGEPFQNNFLLKMLRKTHMTPRINRYIKMPFKSLWNRNLFKNCFDNDNPICFLFFSAGPFADHIPYGFVEYLKEEFPQSKYVVFYQDLVDATKRTVSLDEYRRKMDLIVSFDYNDCDKYQMIYHPLVYSDIREKITEYKEKSDIYFCGAEKNRLGTILEAYNVFQDLGFKCDFTVITNNYKLLNDYSGGIHFCRSFSYHENLQHIKSCKAMIEIMQKGGSGYTIRALECIAFNKKLITNNSYINRATFYDNNNFMYYEKMTDSDIYSKFINSEATSYKYIKAILPHRFLEFIDCHL